MFGGAVAFERELWVLHPSRSLVSPKVRCFIEAAAERLAEPFGRDLT